MEADTEEAMAVTSGEARGKHLSLLLLVAVTNWSGLQGPRSSFFEKSTDDTRTMTQLFHPVQTS